MRRKHILRFPAPQLVDPLDRAEMLEDLREALREIDPREFPEDYAALQQEYDRLLRTKPSA